MAEKKAKEKMSKFDEVKQSAKDYYKWKNMIVRYIILWFLIILLVIQFIWPHKQKNNDEILNESSNIVVSKWWDETMFEFLWETMSRQSMSTLSQIKFDTVMAEIQESFDAQKYSIFHLYQPEVEKILAEYGVPSDFAFLLLSDVELPRWVLSESTRLSLWLQIDDKVNEVLNLRKSTSAIAKYFSELYDKYKDWNLVLMAYSMWEYELDELIDIQWTSDFDELYFYNMDDYYMVMWYSYVFQNLDDCIYTTDIENYDLNLTTVKVWEQKNFRKWCDKNWYEYNQIRQLNPRILWNSLPKWKREIIINN